MNYFIYTSHHFTPHGRCELDKLTSLPICGFTAQLVEHRTGIAEVTGSNPVDALIFSGFFFLRLYCQILLSHFLNWKINCDNHSSLSFTSSLRNFCRETRRIFAFTRALCLGETLVLLDVVSQHIAYIDT